MDNIDEKTIDSFSEEWSRFDQSKFNNEEALISFSEYFFMFPWHILPNNSEGFDMGCGSGRWARFIAPRVAILNCIDPSDSIEVAKKNLSEFKNINFYKTSIKYSNLKKSSQDFGYCLGVLHHLPDTYDGIKSCVELLKRGAPFLVYIYYNFENRPFWFRIIWKVTDFIRKIIIRFPKRIKNFVTDLIAFFVYFPISRFCSFIEKFGIDVNSIPLAYYRNRSYYTMRTDSRDRFGTPLERRFSRIEIENMLINAGLENISFSETAPFWCAVGIKA